MSFIKVAKRGGNIKKKKDTVMFLVEAESLVLILS